MTKTKCHCATRMISFCVLLLALARASSATFNVTFYPPRLQINVDETLNVSVAFPQEVPLTSLRVHAIPNDILQAEFVSSPVVCDSIQENLCNATIQVQGLFLGFGKIIVKSGDVNRTVNSEFVLDVTVLRQDGVFNKVFVAFVAAVVTISYINMGCALDVEVVKDVLRKPIGPAVGFFCQFVVMPLVSYAVGYLVFDDPVLRLGLFTFGSCPGGGASNMWTVLLNGNLNLSITMTFLSTIAAFATIPFWLFTLGTTIITGTEIHIPFKNILISLASLTIPIIIGVQIQRKYPKIAAKSKRLLAPVCIILIIGIIIMAAFANSYMFYMLTWPMILAGILNVWIGFIAGIAVSMMFKFSSEDVVAVCVETGIQNSGIAFILLRYSLKAPVSDMASVVPVAGSIITPIPLFVMFCCMKLKNCYCRTNMFELQPITKKNSTELGLDNPVIVDDKD